MNVSNINIKFMDYSASGDAVAALFAGGIALTIIIFIIIYFAIIIALYVYMALAMRKIAKKTNTPNEWLAWIPIANMILGLQIAKKPEWWIVFMFIPFANIVVIVMMWMGIAKRVGKEEWWGLLILVPIGNLIMPGYLAWSKK